jgi:hypothetical protein
MDIADRAADVEQLERESNLYLAQKRRSARLEPRGACHYCEAKVDPLQVFCDGECADGHDALMKAKVRNHGQSPVED